MPRFLQPDLVAMFLMVIVLLWFKERSNLYLRFIVSRIMALKIKHNDEMLSSQVEKHLKDLEDGKIKTKNFTPEQYKKHLDELLED